MTEQFTCAGVAIDALSPGEATATIVDRGRSGAGGTIHLANAWTLACAVDDPGYRRMLADADLVLADGMPLVWVARRLGLSLPDRIYGPDLLHAVVDLGRSAGLRHHLYGGSAAVVAAVADRLRREHPGAQIAAADAPPFGPVTDTTVEEAADRLAAVDADVVWLALGTPRQDLLAWQLRDRVRAVLVPVGAAFDFLAGAKPQAPRLLQRAGLEWAFRLATEPRRLAHRYLVGNTVFLRELVRDRPRVLPGQAASSS